jgi:hypothetical protein
VADYETVPDATFFDPHVSVGQVTAIEVIGLSQELGLTDACRLGAQHLISVWGHPDQVEGPRAFAEKREPRWKDPV